LSDEEVRYETNEVTAIRGLEAKSIAKWQKDGWEFVSQDEGLLRTKITFRRVKKPIPKPVWYAIAGGALLIAALITVGVLAEGTSSNEADSIAATSPTTVPSEPSAPATPTLQPAPEVEGMTGEEARALFEEAGYTVEFDGLDCPDNCAAVAAEWTVTWTTQSNDGTAVLVLEDPNPGLDEGRAAQYLAMQWEAKFPYGGTVHWIMDRITTPNDDGTFTFKIGATVKNQYGTDVDATIEGDVGGTYENLKIVDSILYTNTGDIIDFHG